ncbi:MAG: hypothetical protein ACYDBQ_12555, partial [Thermoplasmatota archaeon]
SQDDTAAAVEARLEASVHRETHGVWTLKVSLLSAGGCPTPNPSPTNPADPDAGLAAACRYEVGQKTGNPSGPDPGNRLTIELFQYSTFSLVAQPLAGAS